MQSHEAEEAPPGTTPTAEAHEEEYKEHAAHEDANDDEKAPGVESGDAPAADLPNGTADEQAPGTESTAAAATEQKAEETTATTTAAAAPAPEQPPAQAPASSAPAYYSAPSSSSSANPVDVGTEENRRLHVSNLPFRIRDPELRYGNEASLFLCPLSVLVMGVWRVRNETSLSRAHLLALSRRRAACCLMRACALFCIGHAIANAVACSLVLSHRAMFERFGPLEDVEIICNDRGSKGYVARTLHVLHRTLPAALMLPPTSCQALLA